MIELPVCRWRGEQFSTGKFACSIPPSVAFISPNGVSTEVCLQCWYCDKTFSEEELQPTIQPSFTERIASFASAMKIELEWRAKGGASPTDQEIAERKVICHSNKCNAYNKEKDACTLCSCYISSRLIPPIPYGKAECATQSCPIGMWSYTGGYKPQKQGCCNKR